MFPPSLKEAVVEIGTLVENSELILVDVGTLMEIPSFVVDTEAVVEIGTLVENSCFSVVVVVVVVVLKKIVVKFRL